MPFQLASKRVFTALLGLIIVMVLAHLVGLVSTFGFDNSLKGVAHMFNLDMEANAPAGLWPEMGFSRAIA